MSQIIPEGQPELSAEEQAVAAEAARTVGWVEVLERRRQAAAQPQNPDQPNPDAPAIPTAVSPTGTPAAAPSPVPAGVTHDEVAQMVRDEVAAGFESLSKALTEQLAPLLAPQTPTQAPAAHSGPEQPQTGA